MQALPVQKVRDGLSKLRLAAQLASFYEQRATMAARMRFSVKNRPRHERNGETDAPLG
jgi:hypothetical protein